MMLSRAGRVQVYRSGATGRMAHAFHQFARVGACFGDELVTGMAQVMQVNAETRCYECGTPEARRKLACRRGMPCGLVCVPVAVLPAVRSWRHVLAAKAKQALHVPRSSHRGGSTADDLDLRCAGLRGLLAACSGCAVRRRLPRTYAPPGQGLA